MDIIGTTAVGRTVDRHLEKTFKEKPEILNFLKKHDRRPALEAAITRELKGSEARKLLKSGPEHIDLLVGEITKFWASQVLQIHAKGLESHAEKRRQEDVSRRLEIAQDTVHNVVSNLDEDDFVVGEI